MNQRKEPLVITPEITEYYSRRVRLLIQQFPGMPVFVVKLLTELRQAEADIGALSEHIRVDPGITTNLLRLANSARYGSAREIKSVKEAIVRLGIRRTVEMLIAFQVAGHLTKPLQGYNLGPRELLGHALWTAFAAEAICQQTDAANSDYVFTAALLHDLGKVLLSEFVFQEQPLILDLVSSQKRSFDVAEKMVLGWSHADVGAAILDHWNFPDLLIQSVKYHHNPGQAPDEFKSIEYIIHVADFLAYCQGPGGGVDGFSYHFYEESKDKLSLTTQDIERIASQTLEKVSELSEALHL